MTMMRTIQPGEVQQWRPNCPIRLFILTLVKIIMAVSVTKGIMVPVRMIKMMKATIIKIIMVKMMMTVPIIKIIMVPVTPNHLQSHRTQQNTQLRS